MGKKRKGVSNDVLSTLLPGCVSLRDSLLKRVPSLNGLPTAQARQPSQFSSFLAFCYQRLRAPFKPVAPVVTKTCRCFQVLDTPSVHADELATLLLSAIVRVHTHTAKDIVLQTVQASLTMEQVRLQAYGL